MQFWIYVLLTYFLLFFTRYLDDVALHHLIDALCKLSTEAMELAYSNRVSLCLKSFGGGGGWAAPYGL